MKIILASKSQRRIDLLKQFGLEFQAHAANIPESSAQTPERLCTQCILEDQAVLAQFPGSLVIGADTVVALYDQILGKPAANRKPMPFCAFERQETPGLNRCIPAFG